MMFTGTLLGYIDLRYYYVAIAHNAETVISYVVAFA